LKDIAKRQVKSLEQTSESLRCLHHPEQSRDPDDSECSDVDVDFLHERLVHREQRENNDDGVKLIPVDVPVILETVGCDFEHHLSCEDNHKCCICLVKDLSQVVRLAIIINAKEESINYNCGHDEVFKGLGLDLFEANFPETINRLDRDDLGVGMHQQSLDLHPFLLLNSEVVCALSLFDFFVEFVDNYGDEQVENEESRQEDEHNEHQ